MSIERLQTSSPRVRVWAHTKADEQPKTEAGSRVDELLV
jgi:hypothetical protein